MARAWSISSMSIRTRIVVGYVALIAIALAITLLVARGALVARFDAAVDDQLAAEIEQLQLVIAEGDNETGQAYTDAEDLFDTHLRRVLPGDDAAFFTLVDGAPSQLSFNSAVNLFTDQATVDWWASVTTSTFRTISTDVGPARVLVVPVDLSENGGTFVAAKFTENGRQDLNSVFRILAIVGGGVLFASALVAWTIAARVVRPIRELTLVSHSITDSDLSKRFPVDGNDEVAELSRTFNAMMARLERGFRSQREFVDDVAHELRTPITIIQGHLDVLGDDSSERVETVAVLSDELARMNRYVDDLLLLAQAEQPDFLRTGSTNLDVLSTTIMSKVSGLANRRWVLDVTATGEVQIDEQRIVQAVLNLAQNAVRHTSEGDEIGIGVTGGNLVRIWVRDGGPGVDPALVDDLFERHMRSAASRADGGVGLGLSIVDAIASAHGGRVWVESNPDAGATFTIEIPANLKEADAE